MPDNALYNPQGLPDNALVQPNGSPYQQPASYEDALQHLYNLTGIPDLLSAYQAANRGEYLPALGQGAAAGAAMLPALKPFALAPLALAMKGARGGENALLGALPEVNKLMPIRAYHGSPYDFDAFDASKIGTGEGAQAYGHGLYFAEHPEVAKGYRDQLAHSKGYWSYEGKPLSGTSLPEIEDPTKALQNQLYNLQTAQGNALGKFDRSGGDWIHKVEAEDYQRQINQVKSLDPDKLKWVPPGRMYEVNLNADPDTFLHWDKPLSEQPEAIQKYFEDPKGVIFKPHMTGAELYRLIDEPGTGVASDSMARAGINGIKYLDQGSRQPAWNYQGQTYKVTTPGNVVRAEPGSTADILSDLDFKPGESSLDVLRRKTEQYQLHYAKGGNPEFFRKRLDALETLDPKQLQPAEQSHNYVVFDPKIIEIIKKYGLAALIGGGASAVSGNADAATHLIPVDHDPFEDK